MKKTARTEKALGFILVLILLFTAATSNAQNVKTDAQGNYTALSKDTARTSNDELTGKTYTDNAGIKYNVYISTRGKLYVIRTSKTTGKTYKFYLKP